LGRWFRDPGHTVAVVAVTLIVGFAGGGTVVYVAGGKDRPAAVTQTETVTVTEPPPPEEPAPEEAETSVGLEQLEEEEDVEFDVAAEFGNRNIGGESYNDAVTGLVYSDGSGLAELTIRSGGRFSSMHFVVGIDADAECSEARANVSVENESGQPLWGPKPVSIGNPIEQTLSIPNPLQVVLVQRSRETESSCNSGEAHVSWGAVTFQEG
jgi:hypothetical protein